MRKAAVIISIFSFLVAYAQEGQYRLADATQLWRLTDNAAALGLDSTQNRGYALFNAEHQSGDYARVQEGTQTNQLRFQAERYQTVGRYLHAYGRFDFDYGRTKNRAWSDVRRPYNSDPFFAGSSVRGKYDFQDFNFTAALGTVSFNGWRFGLRLDYNVGDLSRLRDPRSRSQLLDYKLTPAVTYTTGRHTVGLGAGYRRRKEKITGVTTVQQDATLKYYLMTGMEHAEGTVGGYSSFSREWVDHRFGAELAYAHRAERLHSLVSATIERGSEDVFGLYKYEPGHYVDYRYGADLRNRLSQGRLLHQLDLHVAYDQAYADEYRQQLQQEKDAQTGYTSFSYNTLLTFKKRYQVRQLDASLHYRLNFLDHTLSAGSGSAAAPAAPAAVASYLGAAVATADAKNRHLLPQSDLHYGGYDLTLEGGTQLPGNRLWIEAAATCHLNSKADLALSDPTTDYAQQVLLPDMAYYEANYWHGRLALTYQFPLKLKGRQSLWFVRAYGDYLKTNNSLDAKTVGLSIGLYN
ncbi:MAG: hypothetical protein IJ612_05925 [Prevotella sp.]|nr:hypothetical protein [Prevotella sp.]